MKKTLMLYLFTSLSIMCKAQIITTVAGGGTMGDGALAINARIDHPCGLVFSKNRELYIASGSSNKVRKIDSCGVISTIAGTGISGYSGDFGAATTSLINFPIGIALDTSSNIYFSELNNHVIRRVDRLSGVITTICGNGTAGYSGDNGPASAALLRNPQNIHIDRFNAIYISDNNHVIRKIDASGVITTIAGTGVAGFNGDGILATNAQLYFPQDVTTDRYGNVYICDQGNSRIRKVDLSGRISTFAGNGAYTYIGDGIPATNAQFVPNFLRFDTIGNLYIAGGERCYKIDTFGIFRTIVGNGTMSTTGDGGPATAATIDHAVGVAIDMCGNPYFSSIESNTIRKVIYDTTCKYCSTSTLGSVVVNSSSNVQIFPNPTHDAFSITAPKPLQAVQLSNAMGQVVYNAQYYGSHATISIAGLPVGMYLVRITYCDGATSVQRMVKD